MKHGGKRLGAGRPKKLNKKRSKVLRVPEHMVESVYRLIQEKDFYLPLFTTRVAAGFPSPADDHSERKLDLNQHLIDNPSSTFFVEVSGESMIDAGINPQDILVVDKSINPAHNKIAIIFFNGDFTVKRLHYVNGRLQQLRPENANFDPICISDTDQVEIWGIVRYVIHRC